MPALTFRSACDGEAEAGGWREGEVVRLGRGVVEVDGLTLREGVVVGGMVGEVVGEFVPSLATAARGRATTKNREMMR